MSLHYRTPQKLAKTVAATATPEKMASVSTPATRAIVCGLKGLSPRVENAGSVWIGVDSVDGAQPVEVGAGSNYILEAVDLAEWYVDVDNAGDGVVVLYW